MAPLTPLSVSIALLLGCGGSVVIHNTTHPGPAASSATTSDQPTRVDYSMRVRVQGREATGERPAESSAERSSAETDSSNVDVALVEDADANVCEGLTVDQVGETRNGRRLGMGLLQVYARPGAELIVDHLHQGETPLIAVGVDAGPRDVRLRNVALGYDCTFRLRVLPGLRYSLLLDVKPD